MNIIKLLSAIAICVGMVFVPAPAQAQSQPIPYNASFSLPTTGSLAALSDNDFATPGTNGFVVGGQKMGTLTFTFTGDWNLSSFTIWNNINKTFGGVTAFQLRFYDSGNNLLGTVTKSNVSRGDNETVIPLAAYTGVHEVKMEITNSDEQIEIREIRFDGTQTPTPAAISTCCPPSTSFALSTMFNSVQGNVANSYHLNFTMNATFDGQMAAYVALLKSLDTSVTSMAMVVSAYNGGTAATPLISVPALQTGVVFWVPPPNPGTSLWPLPAFFTPVADLPSNTWTVVEVTVWVGRPRTPFLQICDTRRFAFRPQIIDALRRSGSSRSGFVDYRGPAPRTAPVAPTAQPRR